MASMGAGAEAESLKDRNDKLCRDRYGAGAEVCVALMSLCVLSCVSVSSHISLRHLNAMHHKIHHTASIPHV